MRYSLKSEMISAEYIESDIDKLVLWESHCHAGYEMIAVIKGDVSVMLEGTSLRLTENQAVIIPPLFYHTVTANKGGEYTRVTVLFDIGAVPTVLRDSFLNKSGIPAVFNYPSAERLKEICMKEDKEFYTPLFESLMVDIFYSDVQAERSEENVTEDSFIKSVVSYVDSHLCEQITLDSLALYTARSKSSFCHLFKEKMKISPKQYILEKKFALALKLIRAGTPPTEASARVGYENYANFYRMYKSRFNKSPSDDHRQSE